MRDCLSAGNAVDVRQDANGRSRRRIRHDRALQEVRVSALWPALAGMRGGRAACSDIQFPVQVHAACGSTCRRGSTCLPGAIEPHPTDWRQAELSVPCDEWGRDGLGESLALSWSRRCLERCRDAAAGAERRERAMPTPLSPNCWAGPDSRNAEGTSRRACAVGGHRRTMVTHRRSMPRSGLLVISTGFPSRIPDSVYRVERPRQTSMISAI